MAKSDSPPFRMIVEKGPRLAPATASDAERLDTWRVGSAVSVQFVRNGSRVMERKWFAILGLVVERCNVPWKTKEQASEAVKLALGIVNLTKTVGGAWMQYPKSLTELTDPELDDAVRDMMDLIQKLTGIDPETLRKEAADVGRDEAEQPEAPVNPASGSGSGETSSPSSDPAPEQSEIASPAGERIQSGQDEAMESAPATEDPSVGAGPHQSAAADLKEDGAEPGGASAGDDAPSSDPRDPLVILNLKAEAVAKFMDLATGTKLCPDPKDRRGALVMAAKAWKVEMPHHHDFLKTCFLTAERVIKEEMPADQAREYLQGLVR